VALQLSHSIPAFGFRRLALVREVANVQQVVVMASFIGQHQQDSFGGRRKVRLGRVHLRYYLRDCRLDELRRCLLCPLELCLKVVAQSQQRRGSFEYSGLRVERRYRHGQGKQFPGIDVMHA
jgi:hypothetical protein